MTHAKSLAWHRPWKGLSGHLLFVSSPLFPGRKLRPRGAKCLGLDPVIPIAGPAPPSAELTVMAGAMVTCCCWQAAALSPCTFLLPGLLSFPISMEGGGTEAPAGQVFWQRAHGGSWCDWGGGDEGKVHSALQYAWEICPSTCWFQFFHQNSQNTCL